MEHLDTISFEELTSISYDYLVEQQEICEDKYKISSYENWFYEQEIAELTFSNGNDKKLIIKYEDVGTISLLTKTWLWSWANAHSVAKVRSKIIAVKDYGQRRGFEKLIKDKWTAGEVDGWEMTCIAAYLMKAKGAYRVPLNDDTLLGFMIFKEINWADQTQ